MRNDVVGVGNLHLGSRRANRGDHRAATMGSQPDVRVQQGDSVIRRSALKCHRRSAALGSASRQMAGWWPTGAGELPWEGGRRRVGRCRRTVRSVPNGIARGTRAAASGSGACSAAARGMSRRSRTGAGPRCRAAGLVAEGVQVGRAGRLDRLGVGAAVPAAAPDPEQRPVPDPARVQQRWPGFPGAVAAPAVAVAVARGMTAIAEFGRGPSGANRPPRARSGVRAWGGWPAVEDLPAPHPLRTRPRGAGRCRAPGGALALDGRFRPPIPPAAGDPARMAIAAVDHGSGVARGEIASGGAPGDAVPRGCGIALT